MPAHLPSAPPRNLRGPPLCWSVDQMLDAVVKGGASMARRVASSFMSTSASVLVYVPGAIPAAKSPLWRLRSPKFFFARAERARTGSAPPDTSGVTPEATIYLDYYYYV